MDKFYIHQLRNGKMLVFEDNLFSIEETGYPLPDCSLTVNGRKYDNQADIFKVIMGYVPENDLEFIEFLEQIEPMDFDTFKYTVQSKNIGGGCSQKITKIAIEILENGLTFNQAVFKHTIPDRFLNDECILPSDEDIVNEYGDLLGLSWNNRVNKPNSIFRNNILMFTGVKNISDKHIEFIKDLINICMSSLAKEQFKYLTTITAENGIGAIILIDSVTNNADFEYFYTKITGVSLSDGIIRVVTADDTLKLSFESEEDLKEYYKNIKSFNGTFKRYNL